MATLATMQANVAGRLGLNNATGASGGDQDYVTGWLNEGVLDVLRRTHCYVTSDTLTLTVNVGDYDLLSLKPNWLAVDELYLTSGSQAYQLRPRPARSVLAMRANAAASSPATFYALLGGNLLLVYPTPNVADVLTVYVVPRPTAMSAAGNDPSAATYGGIPAEYHPAVECYAMWKAGAYKKDIASSQGERYRIEYEGERGTGGRISGMKRDLSHKAGRPLGHFVVPAQDVLVGPYHDPSADFRS